MNGNLSEWFKKYMGVSTSNRASIVRANIVVVNVAAVSGGLMLATLNASAAEGIYATQPGGLTSFVSDSNLYLNVRSRFESVEQENSLDDASAMTLRSRLGFQSGDYSGVSFQVEFENSRIIGDQDEFTVGPTNFNVGEYSVVADPETSEIDQANIQVSNALFGNPLDVVLGRQLITHGNHRFVGHVGWRQDRQTFDALSLKYRIGEDISLQYQFIDQRNTIFAKSRDVDSTDHLVSMSYKLGNQTVSSYGYFLDLDESDRDLHNTVGVRFAGNVLDSAANYSVEWAGQRSRNLADTKETRYWSVSLANTFGKGYKANVQYESLGSDNGEAGFTTPLATLHKFNGWADQFLVTPNQGLNDLTLSLSNKLFGGTWRVAYHNFTADESLLGQDDLGDEIDVSYTIAFGKRYATGVKFASYQRGDEVFNRVDTDKIWMWFSLNV